MKKQWLLLPTLRVVFFLSLALMSARVSMRAQTVSEPAATSVVSPAPYRVGEKLSYSVSFSNFLEAAHLEFFVAARSTTAGRESVELRGHIETTGVVSAALYAVNNDYIAYVEPQTGLPIRTEQVIREGARTANAARDYNQPAGVSALPAARQRTVNVAGTYDFVSAFYRLRALPLAQGAVYALSVQGASETYDAELRVTGRELLKTNVGSVNSLVTEVRVPRNPVVNNYRIRIYFSDDERHIPVLITAQHPSGEIRAEIASADFVSEVARPLIADTPAIPANPRPTPTRVLPGVPQPLPGMTPDVGRTDGATGVGSAADTPRDLPFSVGEQLNFTFFLGNTQQPVGTAALQVRARARYFNRDGLLLSSVMSTSGTGQTLFPVSDQITSYVDATSLLPFRSELRLQEGRRRANWTVSVDQDRGTALFDDGTRLEIPVGTHDLISVLYALRSFDLTPPKRNAVSLLINKRPRALFITSLRRQNIQLNNQNIPAVELSLVTDDAQGDRLQIRLWVSTDRRRLPLRITAVTPLGPVRADLAIIPLTSQ
ncbi:MAG TPA: DUF3108 domain-containing protein [Pyrinomonadaceae bacterium]